MLCRPGNLLGAVLGDWELRIQGLFGLYVLDDSGLHADQVCASVVPLSSAAAAPAAAFHLRGNNIVNVA
jgi:hypothetical protein